MGASNISYYMLQYGFDYQNPNVLYQVIQDQGSGCLQCDLIGQVGTLDKSSAVSKSKSVKSKASHKPQAKDFQTDYEGPAPDRKARAASMSAKKARKEPKAPSSAVQKSTEKKAEKKPALSLSAAKKASRQSSRAQ